MLEVIDFFSQKHFERLSKIVTQKGISCGRKGLCVFAPDRVCVFGVCLCVVRLPGSSDIPLWISARKEQPGNPHQQAKTLQCSGTVPSLHPRRSASD